MNNGTLHIEISSPLDQFEVRDLLSLDAPILADLHISITNLGFYLTIACLIIFAINLLAVNYNKVVSNSWSVSQESIYATVHSIVINQINANKGQIYFPFIYALFMFILINNLIGMVPYSFASTSHFILTFSISFTVVLGATILGFNRHGLANADNFLTFAFLALISSMYTQLSPKPHSFTSFPLQSKMSISLNIFPLDAITRGLINFYNILTISFCLKTLKNSTIFKVYIYIFASILLLLGLEPFTVSLNISLLLILYYTASFYVRYKFKFDMWITGLTVLVLTLICLVIFWSLLLLVIGYALELTTILSISTGSAFLLNYELLMSPGDPGSNGGEGSSSGGAGGPPGGPSGGGLPEGVNNLETNDNTKWKRKYRELLAGEKRVEKFMKSDEAEASYKKNKQSLNHILNVTDEKDGPKQFNDVDLAHAIIQSEIENPNPDLGLLKEYRSLLSVFKKAVMSEMDEKKLVGQDKLDGNIRVNQYQKQINSLDHAIRNHPDRNI